MDVSPAIRTMDAAPEPSSTAAPLRVIVPVAVSPLALEAPTVMVPAAWVTLPLTAKSNDPMAIVPLHPLVSKDAIAAFWSTMAVPLPEPESKKTVTAALGTEQPPTPPDDGAQWAVCDQLPAPPIQYRLLPHAEAIMTSTTGSEPSMLKTTWPDAFTIPFVKPMASFVTLNRLPTVFPPIVNLIDEVPTVDESVQL
jgi:hypothetical protein